MEKKSILFVCIHNSARSRMAEAFLNKEGDEKFIARSAGLEPGVVNPIAAAVMNELDIDISRQKSRSTAEVIASGETYDYVITVCDAASGERCPVFPGKGVIRLHWGFEDPSALSGSRDEKLAAARQIRDQIHQKVLQFINE